MRLLSMHDIDKDMYSSMTQHEYIVMAFVIKDWCRENEVEDFRSVIFRDLRGAVVPQDARLADLPTFPFFPNVTKVTVQRIEKTGEILTTLLKPEKRFPTGNWTVEPTVGENSVGRWIARPVLDLCPPDYKVLAGLVVVDKDIEFITVTLPPNGTVAHAREFLAEEKGRPIEDFLYTYEWGEMCKTKEGTKHATTYCTQGIQKRMDDDFHEMPENELFATITHIYEETRFSVPLVGGPLWIFHLGNKYFSLSKDESAPYQLADDQYRPLTDPSVLCFVDGFFFEDLSSPEPRTPRLFVSVENGDVFVDVETGILYSSRELVSKSDVQEEVAEENRKWGSFVFLFKDNERIPRWKLPKEQNLQFHSAPQLEMRIQDGRLTSSKPRGVTTRWHISTVPPMEEGSQGICDFMRSLTEPE